MSAKTKAATDLIKEAKNRKKFPDLAPAVLAELKKLVEYNDQEPSMAKRIGSSKAVDMLRSHGVHISERTLDKICKNQLKRTSYTRP